MDSVGLEDLPLLDRVDVRRLDRTVTPESMGGAMLGYLLGESLGIPLRVLAAAAHRVAGWPMGHVAYIVGFVGAAYVAVLAVVNWQSLDEDGGGS